MIRRLAWILSAAAGSALIGLTGGAVFAPGDGSGGVLLRPWGTTSTTAIVQAAALAATPATTVDVDSLQPLPVPAPIPPPIAAAAGVSAPAPTPATPPPTASPVTAPTPSTSITIPAPPPSTSASTTTITTVPPSTTTTTVAPLAGGGEGLRLWDTAWQIAAKADESAMREYVDRLAAATGTGGGTVTGFWFSVVNINQDITTPNGYGHTFGSFSSPDPAYLDDVERLIALAGERGLKVGIVVAWDGPTQFSVESGQLTVANAYAYGTAIAERWTRPDFAGRTAIEAWVMGGDTTDDCCGGEHGAVWAEVVRGIEDAQAANGFAGPLILLHTAPGQHLNYVGAPWLDAHAPQTGHCADTATAVGWMEELAGAGARIWGNGEMRYEGITWSCNGNVAISPQQVRDDTRAMRDIGLRNHVYGFDPRWNASRPGDVGMSASGVSEGLQLILDESGLVVPR